MMVSRYRTSVWTMRSMPCSVPSGGYMAKYSVTSRRFSIAADVFQLQV